MFGKKATLAQRKCSGLIEVVMQLLPINETHYEETLNAFQPFYKEPLTKEDAIEIQGNIRALCDWIERTKEC